ncbi:XRE family transcriptional regulator [Paraeggerthella sp. LCP19S3_G8]|uniref:XRE family transcriptional regulator n=1 Tax=Paraeggerthella sp. LCP19S3_G8 TaxID=3440248 RepID=UPI002A8FAEC1|nr:XRE family transcriptional regulator [Paraeggerthella sp.]
MKEPLTEELLEELLEAPDPIRFAEENHIATRSLSDYLEQLLDEKGLERARVVREANRLLQAAGSNGLYCKNRRDAIVIFCLERGHSLQKTDEELYRFGEETIC